MLAPADDRPRAWHRPLRRLLASKLSTIPREATLASQPPRHAMPPRQVLEQVTDSVVGLDAVELPLPALVPLVAELLQVAVDGPVLRDLRDQPWLVQTPGTGARRADLPNGPWTTTGRSLARGSRGKCLTERNRRHA